MEPQALAAQNKMPYADSRASLPYPPVAAYQNPSARSSSAEPWPVKRSKAMAKCGEMEVDTLKGSPREAKDGLARPGLRTLQRL